jgi:hypothetical protein
MSKFFEWFDSNRKSIGYTIGGLNVISGINSLLIGNTTHGCIFLFAGVIILVDTKTYKYK